MKIVSHKDIPFGQAAELMQTLIRQGLDPRGIQRVIENKDLAVRVANMINGVDSGETTAFADVIKTVKHTLIPISSSLRMGLDFPSKVLSSYKKVPFSGIELQDGAKLGMWLVAMPPVSLNLLVAVSPQYFPEGNLWFAHERFAMEVTTPRYLLIRQLPDSEEKDWETQLTMHPERHRALSAVEVVYCVLAMRILEISKLPFTTKVRTGDVTSVGYNVNAQMVPEGINVGFDWGGSRPQLAVVSGISRELIP